MTRSLRIDDANLILHVDTHACNFNSVSLLFHVRYATNIKTVLTGKSFGRFFSVSHVWSLFPRARIFHLNQRRPTRHCFIFTQNKLIGLMIPSENPQPTRGNYFVSVALADKRWFRQTLAQISSVHIPSSSESAPPQEGKVKYYNKKTELELMPWVFTLRLCSIMYQKREWFPSWSYLPRWNWARVHVSYVLPMGGLSNPWLSAKWAKVSSGNHITLN